MLLWCSASGANSTRSLCVNRTQRRGAHSHDVSVGTSQLVGPPADHPPSLPVSHHPQWATLLLWRTGAVTLSTRSTETAAGTLMRKSCAQCSKVRYQERGGADCARVASSTCAYATFPQRRHRSHGPETNRCADGVAPSATLVCFCFGHTAEAVAAWQRLLWRHASPAPFTPRYSPR